MDQFVEKFREPYAELFLADHISAVIRVQGERPEPPDCRRYIQAGGYPGAAGFVSGGETGAFRQMFGAEGYEVVAINDLTSPKILKYDSSQGKYEHADEVSASDDSITVCGKEIKIYAFPDANNCPWGELKVDVVLECSGFYTSKKRRLRLISMLELVR